MFSSRAESALQGSLGWSPNVIDLRKESGKVMLGSLRVMVNSDAEGITYL